MKPERISIFNYEAFYLDHLEGTLGEEDTALLLAFLEENPKLKMEDEALPIFDAEDYLLTAIEKLELKQSDEDEAIVLENVEYFMIAEAEGLLSDEKTTELDAVVAKNAEIEKDRAYFGAVSMKPDLSIVYENKDGLKRKVVVLWPYVAMAAAASVVIAFFLLTNNQLEEIVAPVAEEEIPIEIRKNNERNTLEKENSPEQIAEELNENPTVIQNANNVNYSAPENQQLNLDRNQNDLVNMATLDRREARTLVHSLEGFNIQPISRNLPAVSQNEENLGGDVAYTGHEHMSDPIQGVTSRINNRIKPEVEFKTAKATDSQSGGFFLKVGRFEFMRKKHK